MAAFVEVAVLVLMVWPILRATAHPALRRAFPRTVVLLTCLALAWVAGVIGLAIWFPRLLHLLTVFAVGGALYALVRAHPGYGRWRRLPPGSLAPLPFAYLIDPFFFRKQVERHGPIFKMNQFGTAAGPNPIRGLVQPVCCVDLKHGMKILHDHDEYLVYPPIPASRFIPKKYLREMKPEDHLRYRQMFGSAFIPEVVDGNAAFIAGHFRASLLRLVEESSSSGNRGVAPERPLIAMTFGVFVRCFLGILPDDERFGRLEELANVIDVANRDDRNVSLALDELARICRQEAHQARAENGSRSRSFLGEIAHAEPDAFDDLTAVRNFIYIMRFSWFDTAGLIVWLFKELCDNPDWTARLSVGIEPKATEGAEPLGLRFVKEALRLRQSEYIFRSVLHDIPVEEYVIPKGWLLRVCIRESHRDPGVFEDPNTFNPDRFLTRRYARTDYSTFGASRISCLGEHLVLAVGRIFVEEFAATVATSTVQDGPLEYRRWHWKPSSKWRVRVTRPDREAPPNTARKEASLYSK